MYQKPFANDLRAHRQKSGLRQADVAQLLSLDCADRISRWEHGTAIPSLVNLFRLAALYRVMPHELYRELYEAIQKTAGPAEMAAQIPINPASQGTSDCHI
ncbi:MAG: helix-turn-helix transcriptional regulator [Verrucomicrobiota bacterium]